MPFHASKNLSVNIKLVHKFNIIILYNIYEVYEYINQDRLLQIYRNKTLLNEIDSLKFFIPFNTQIIIKTDTF